MILDKFFRTTVYAIVEVFISEIDPRYEKSVIDKSVDFILKVHASMQPLYRHGLIFISIGFCCYAFFLTGRIFQKLPNERRLNLIRKWIASSIGVRRNFINFFLNMTMLFYYDSDGVLEELGVDIKSHRKIQCFYAGAD